MAKKRRKTVKRQIKQLDWKFIILAVGIILLGISILALNQKLTYKSSARIEEGAGNVAPNTDPIDDSNDKFPNERDDDDNDRDDNDDNGGNGDKDNNNNNTDNDGGEGTKVWKKDYVTITTYADGSQEYCDRSGCNYTDADGNQIGNTLDPDGIQGWTGQTPPNTELNDGRKPGEPMKSYTQFQSFMWLLENGLKSGHWQEMKDKGYVWKWGRGWEPDPNYEPPEPREDREPEGWK